MLDDLVITEEEPAPQAFDPEKELELFRQKVEREMGIRLDEEEPEAEPAEEPAQAAEEPVSQSTGFRADADQTAPAAPAAVDDFLKDFIPDAEQSAAEAPLDKAAEPQTMFDEPAAEAPVEAPIQEPAHSREDDFFKFAPAEPKKDLKPAAAAAAVAATAAEQSIEDRVKADAAGTADQADSRITYHDVFADEILEEKNGKKDKPKKHTGLKVLAIILCILIIAEILVIAIKYMAPDSAAAIKLQDIFNSVYGSIGSLFG